MKQNRCHYFKSFATFVLRHLPAQQSGGGVLGLLPCYFGGCKKNKNRYNSDIAHHYCNEVLNMKKAFTLAEVLVTLGIIGVVSAMTVPSLMQNHQRKTYVTQLHKVYNELQQASLQYMTDNNAINMKEAGINSDDAASDFIKKYFKVVQDCGADKSPCFPEHTVYKKLSGAENSVWVGKRHFVLASGASVSTYYHPEDELLLEFWVDINGQNGPNIIGRDLFGMYMSVDGVLDDLTYKFPLSKEERENKFNTVCKAANQGNLHGCFGKILNDNWEMTY